MPQCCIYLSLLLAQSPALSLAYALYNICIYIYIYLFVYIVGIRYLLCIYISE